MDDITRQDMMVILERALRVSEQDKKLESKGIDYDDFSDSNTIADYATESVEYLIDTDIIHGYDNKIYSHSKTTRAEIAQMIYNLLLELNK